MPFSDTSGKSGLIQAIEFWTNLGDAAISGDTTLLAVMTGRLNEAFDRVMPRLLSYTGYMRWDDANNTDLPIAKFDIVSGQPDYTIAQDDNSLEILNISKVRILQSSSATDYATLPEIRIDDGRAVRAMSPNPTDLGVPSAWLKQNSTIFLDLCPNYSATNGIKIFFERQQTYFAATGANSRVPGIPRPFHGILALYAAHDWLVADPDTSPLIVTRLEAQITKRERELDDLISMRNPTKARMTARIEDAE